jgi:hypothetical protein
MDLEAAKPAEIFKPGMVTNADVNDALLDIQMIISAEEAGFYDASGSSVPIALEVKFDAYEKYTVFIKSLQITINKIIERLGGKADMYINSEDGLNSECKSQDGKHQFEVRVYDRTAKQLIIGCKECNEEYEIRGGT